METIRITVPACFTVRMYNGPKGDANRKATELLQTFETWDESALAALFRKGAQRLVNDLLSGVDAKDKPAAAAQVIDKLNAGETWHAASGTAPRVAGAKVDRVTVEARSLARAIIKREMDREAYKAQFTVAVAAEQNAKLDHWLATDKRAEKVWQEAARRAEFAVDL